MGVVLVKNANRMMTSASLLDAGIELSFADGFSGLIPYADVPEVKVRAGISGLELPDPYEMVLQTAEGERVEIPWDFARRYCDASYRPTVEAIAAVGRHTLGERVRRFRAAAGLTQVELARAADIGRVTSGAAGEWGAEPQVQDPDGHSAHPGVGRPGAAGRAGAAPAVAAGKPNMSRNAGERCRQTTKALLWTWKPTSTTCAR